MHDAPRSTPPLAEPSHLEKPFRFFETLRAQFLLFTAAALLPFLILLSVIVFGNAERGREDAREAALVQAGVVSSRVDAYLTAVEAMLLAAHYLLGEELDDPETVHRKLAALKGALPAYVNGMSVVNPRGDIIADALSVVGPSDAVNVADRNYFRQAVAGARFAVGDPVVSRRSDNWIIVVAHPIHNAKGELRAVVTASTDLEGFHEMLSGQVPAGTRIAMLNQDGVVLSRSHDRKASIGRSFKGFAPVDYALEHKEGGLDSTVIDGIPAVLGFKTASVAPWLTVVGIPERIALAEARSEQKRFLLAVAATLVAALLFAYWVSRCISRPIKRLAERASHIAETQDLSLAPAHAPRGEVGQLVRAFNRMTAALASAKAELKAKHASLEALNRELETRVARRTADLNDAMKELEAFSYSVSHDLRAPVRAIGGYAEMMAETLPQDAFVDANDYLQRIGGLTAKMNKMIDDFLRLSRVSGSQMRPRRVDLSELGAQVARGLRERDPGRKVSVTVAPGMSASCDSNLVQIALENLLGNAWKYTGKSDHASIEFGSEELDGERVFFVRDNGAGFDMKYADRLFQPFQRMHTAKEFEGTGIGLATVYRIIRRHHGRIWADAHVNRGATFRFTLPDDEEDSK
jgi:signal transduction histidine kinase